MSTSPTLRVLMVGHVPGDQWLQSRLAQLDPPAEVRCIKVLDHQQADLLINRDVVFTSESGVEIVRAHSPGALVCGAVVVDDGSVQLMPFVEDQSPLVHLLEKQLNASPGAVLQRIVERMSLVYEVILEIAALHDLDQILRIVPNRLTEVFGYYHASVGVINQDSIEMYEASQRSRAIGPERFHIPLYADGIVAWVARQGTVYLAGDTYQDGLWVPGKGLETARAELAVPLIYREHVIGVIDVQSEHINAFDQGDVSVLRALAGQLAVAVKNARLFDEKQRQRQIAETLSRVSRLAGVLLDVREVSQMVLDELAKLIVFDAALIALCEDDVFRVVHQVGYGSINGPEVRWLAEESPLLYRILQQHETILIADTTADRVWQKVAAQQTTRTWMGVPLLSRGQPIGIIAAASFSPNAYQQADQDLLLAFANQIAGTIDNARLFECSEQREREARALYDITRLLVTLDQDSIPASVLTELAHALSFDVAGMLVVNGAERLIITAKRAVTDGVLQAVEERLLSAYYALSRETINPQAVHHQIVPIGPFGEDKQIDQLQVNLAAPLLVGRQVVGGIELGKADPEPYTEAERRTLHIIANTTATALENTRLYQELMARALNLQQAVDELAEADRLKDELVGNVSHELRAPLTYVVGYVDLLLTGEMGDLTSQQRESLKIVAAKSKMLTRLVSDILSFETSDNQPLAFAETNLVSLAQQAVQDCLITAEGAGIQIFTEFDPGVRPIVLDPDRIMQVFANLLGNAIKFTSAGGTITVRVLLREHSVCVEVEDTGLGIPADKLPRVFERFFQVDMESRRHRKGVGLGLAICKKIVEAHGGRIGATSQEGVGSTFYFELPDIRPDLSTDVDGAEDGAGNDG